MMDEVLSGLVSFSLQVEETTTNASFKARLEVARASLLLWISISFLRFLAGEAVRDCCFFLSRGFPVPQPPPHAILTRNTIWARITKSAPSTFTAQRALLISHQSTRRAWRLIKAIGLYGLIFHWVYWSSILSITHYKLLIVGNGVKMVPSFYTHPKPRFHLKMS